MRWHADAGERCEVCLSCNVPIMFRWTKRDGPAGCVCCPWCRAVPRRAVRMDYRSISVASIKIIKAPPFLFRIAGSRSSPRTQFAASTTTHISGTRHGSRELENISTHETSPHLCLLRAEPEQDRRRGASVTLSLYRAHSWPYHTARMAVSHNAHYTRDGPFSCPAASQDLTNLSAPCPPSPPAPRPPRHRRQAGWRGSRSLWRPDPSVSPPCTCRTRCARCTRATPRA